MKLKYQKLNAGKCGGTTVYQEVEIGLFSGVFKRKCHNFGKLGHKTKECKAGGGGAHKSFGGKHDKNKNTEIECYYCHEKGHILKECSKLQKKNGKANTAIENKEGEMSLTARELNELKDVSFVMGTSPEKELFIADSGTLVHLIGTIKGMTKFKQFER